MTHPSWARRTGSNLRCCTDNRPLRIGRNSATPPRCGGHFDETSVNWKRERCAVRDGLVGDAARYLMSSLASLIIHVPFGVRRHCSTLETSGDFPLISASRAESASLERIPLAPRAYTAFWLPGRDQIVYVTPEGLAPLPGQQRKHNVWVQQLMFFDPVKGTPTAITSGLTNNVDPSLCESSR
jgi:hypothetical protein